MLEHKTNKAVFGLFTSQFSLEVAVEALRNQGFHNSDLSVLSPGSDSGTNFAHEQSTFSADRAATGITGGAIVGGSLGWLVGIGAIAIPGIGPLMVAGPIVAAIAGVGIGGALGGIGGALIDLGIPEDEAHLYENQIRGGATLLSVQVNDVEWERKAYDAFEMAGAEDIHCIGKQAPNVTQVSDGISSSVHH
jgi:uncharacterized membrane protein